MFKHVALYLTIKDAIQKQTVSLRDVLSSLESSFGSDQMSKPFSHPLHTQFPSMMHELSVNLHKVPYLASVDNPPAASQRQPCAKSDASLYF